MVPLAEASIWLKIKALRKAGGRLVPRIVPHCPACLPQFLRMYMTRERPPAGGL